MAFTQKNLSLMAYTGAGATHQNFWYYIEPAGDDWEDANYFANALPFMKAGDIIAGNDGQLRYVSAADAAAGTIATTAVNA